MSRPFAVASHFSSPPFLVTATYSLYNYLVDMFLAKRFFSQANEQPLTSTDAASLSVPMKTVLFKARYMDQSALEAFLEVIFSGRAEVIWTRGVFQCRVPRGLKQNELDALSQAIELERYSET